MKVASILAIIFLIGCLVYYVVVDRKSPAVTTDSSKATTADTVTANQQPLVDTITPAATDTTVAETTDTAKVVPLTLVFKNLASSSGTIQVGLYKRDGKFLKAETEFKHYKFKPNGNELSVKITDLKFGEYALAIYQDKNDNGKIDKNVLGIPTEPYAFSNNYVPKVKAPSFDDCHFQYNQNNNLVAMKMIN